MKIGLCAPVGAPFATAEYLSVLAREADQRGFDSIWLGEHVVRFDDYAPTYPYSATGRMSDLPGEGQLESLTTLSFLAAASSTIRLGTGVLILAQRNPVVTAFQIATLDWLSGGRLDVGIGLNWCREEYAAVGVPWEHRGARTDEYIEVVRRLLTDEVAAHSGPFYELPPCRLHPRPVQKPHPRFFISGNSDAALRRTARVGQGWYGLAMSPEQTTERMQTLSRFLADEGRRLDEIDATMIAFRPGTATVPASIVPQFAEAGLNRLVAMVGATTADLLRRQLDEFSGYVEAAAAVRS